MDKKQMQRSLHPTIASAWRACRHSQAGDVLLYIRYSTKDGRRYRGGEMLRPADKETAALVIVIVQRATGGKAIAQWRRRDGAWALLVEATADEMAETGMPMALLRRPLTPLLAP